MILDSSPPETIKSKITKQLAHELRSKGLVGSPAWGKAAREAAIALSKHQDEDFAV